MTFLQRTLPALLIALLAIAMPWNTASAQEQMRQTELDRALVERFLASYPEVRAVGEKYEKERPGQSGSEDPVAALSGFMQHKQALGEIKTVLDKHDFATFTQWLDVARSVAIAYGFVKSGKTPGELGNQADKALEEIRKNPDLNDAQKKQMELMVTQQMDMLKEFEPPAKNLAIVTEMKPQIAAVLDSD